MPVLREQIEVPSEPVLRLTTPGEEPEPVQEVADAMSAALGLRVSASLYEVWRASDLWHMAGGHAKPLATVSATLAREVTLEEFSAAVSAAVNGVLGYEGCRPVGRDRIRADGPETVSTIVDKLINKRQGRSMLNAVVANLARD